MDPATIVQRWWDELWGEGRLELIDELLAERFVRHNREGTRVFTPEEYKKELGSFLQSIRWAETNVDDQVVAGDKVWSRLTSRGVALDTEERVTVTWFQVHRIENGRIAEMWVMYLRGVDWSGG